MSEPWPEADAAKEKQMMAEEAALGALGRNDEAELVDPQPDGQHPISGYTKQEPWKIELVNEIKELENCLGEMLNETGQNMNVDPRMLALARTNLQQGFMWWVRSIFQPVSKL